MNDNQTINNEVVLIDATNSSLGELICCNNSSSTLSCADGFSVEELNLKGQEEVKCSIDVHSTGNAEGESIAGVRSLINSCTGCASSYKDPLRFFEEGFSLVDSVCTGSVAAEYGRDYYIMFGVMNSVKSRYFNCALNDQISAVVSVVEQVLCRGYEPYLIIDSKSAVLCGICDRNKWRYVFRERQLSFDFKY